MKAFYTDHFILPLPEGHRFPMAKYETLREYALAQAVLRDDELHVPDAATDVEILRVHDIGYLHKVITGGLSDKEIRRMGFPWSPQLVERSRRSVGGTICACRTVLTTDDRFAVNLAGGTHHAHPTFGAGFCVFNDVAIAARAMQAEHLAQRITVIDCDVHQGDGTAAIFADDDTVFTLSLHGEKNFPFRKAQSDLDIGLDDGTGDEEYLAALKQGVALALDLSEPDLVIYLAGADPYAGDRLGRLGLSKHGLAARDHFVLTTCDERDIPVAITMAGGYARDFRDIAEIHSETIRTAHALNHNGSFM